MAKINVVETGIKGLVVVEPTIFGDERGFFLETYNARDYEAAGLKVKFVQDNLSKSGKGVLRGLHFQVKYPQGKLISVVSGNVFDVVVDLRKGSDTYSKWYGIELTGENKKQMYIPPGFAHGFVVLSEDAVFMYKSTEYYHPEDEGGLIWNDPAIGIEWPFSPNFKVLLSERDSRLTSLRETRYELIPG